MFHKVTLSYVCLILALSAEAQDCVWEKDSFPANSPLLIDLESWLAFHAVLEDGTRVVRIPEGSSVVVACSGSTIAIGGEVAEGTCNAGSFEIDGTAYSIDDLACGDTPDDDALYTGATCGNGDVGLEASIGFDVPGYKFYEMINICFEATMKTPIYAKHIVFGASYEAADSNPSRPSFKMDSGFYDINPDDCYSSATQEAYYNELMGDDNFINSGSNEFFSRGHLAPNADFFLEMEADATFFYINAVPQWQNYNGINWAQFEDTVRELAASYDTNVEVWTGPWNNLIMDDVNGNPVTFYHCGSQGSETVPVPEVVWKVVYEPSTDSGLAVIVSNVPYEESVPDALCPDIGCDSVLWMDGITSPSQLDRGYLYCCSVQDFRSAVPQAPDLGSAGLLVNWGKMSN